MVDDDSPGPPFPCNAADKYGRKKLILSCFLTNILVSYSIAFITHPDLYMLLRFLCGFLQGGTFITMFTLASEWFGKEYWSIVSAYLTFVSGVSKSFMALLGTLVRDWRELLIVTSSMAVPIWIIIWVWIPESPRWLLQNNRAGEAEDILRNMAKRNGRKNWQDIKNLKVSEQNQNGSECFSSALKKNKSETIKQGLKNKNFLTRLRNLLLVWFTCGLTDYYIIYGAARLGGNIYENLGMQGISEIPIILITIYVMQNFNRRPIYLVTWILTILAFLFLGLGHLVFPILSEKTSTPALLLATIAKAIVGFAFGLSYIYSNEAFPTTLRASSVGLCSMAARVGAIISPFMVEMGETLSLYVLAGLCVVVCYFSYNLPETFNQPVLKNLKDLDEYSRSTSALSLGSNDSVDLEMEDKKGLLENVDLNSDED